MPRGRPKKMKNQTSINGEEIAGSVAVIDPPRDERDLQISRLEAQLKDFEQRLSKRDHTQPEVQQPIVAKPKPALPVPQIIAEVTTRDLFELEDRKPVTGVFKMQNKKPGEKGIVRVGALRKYKEDHMKPWIFEHNKTYTIPKWVADWLNGGETNPEDKVKSPRCNVISHNDQWNDLQNKAPLGAPTLSPMYSFTPVAKW